MEKKTIDTLRVMLCGEIEDIAKQGKLSHETLDVLKDLVETEKNLAKIEKYGEEKQEKEEMKKMGGMGMPMDGGYSQRKYYIDADYQPGQAFAGGGSYGMGNFYARGNGGGGGASRAGGYAYDMGDMYARAGGQGGGGGNSRTGMYDMGGSYEGGNSYMYYDPRYEQMPMYSMARGGNRYSREGGDAQEMKKELKEMMNETQDTKVKEAIQKALNELNK